MIKRSVLAGAALLLGATQLSFADDHEAWRLFYADAEYPAVVGIDLESGDALGTYPIESVARVYPGETGEYVYAVQGEAGTVAAIATGIGFDDHGDHHDMTLGDPEFLGEVVSGERPVHFVPHEGQIAVFFDGEGSIKVFEESQVGGDGLELATFKSNRPHHGVGVVAHEHVLLTEPVAESDAALPDWVRVLDQDGNQVGDLHDCGGLHGEASSGHLIAFACADGVLVFSETDGGLTSKFLPYPASFPDARSGTLRGVKAFELFVGNFGSEAGILVDPSATEPYRLIEFSSPKLGFILDDHRVKYAYALGFDGVLHEIDLLSATVGRSVQVTGAYSTEGGHGTVRPSLAMAGSQIVVSDPDANAVHLISAEGFELSKTLELQGKPYSIAVVGGELGDHH